MDRDKLVVGVTGGIGSGKTAVTDFFAAKGVTIVDADLAARVVVTSGQPALMKIAERHGNQIILNDGSLDRRQLRSIVFQSDNERIWLEKLLHPLIRKQIISELTQSQSHYSILVSPLMIETNQIELIGRLLVVDVPVEIQIERTMNRDNMTREQTQAIIEKQSSRTKKLKLADDIVDNTQSLLHLHQQLEALHQKYLDI
ncbi:dephospho-CoA kinase [Endozoicomonas sp. (ex Bugula neritina AB1)]|nr:dephospho-CoA kinase [Endozoicomonas sp. (ex Bugula neritina AB1)]